MQFLNFSQTLMVIDRFPQNDRMFFVRHIFLMENTPLLYIGHRSPYQKLTLPAKNDNLGGGCC